MQAEEDNFGLMRELPNSRRDILAGAFAAFLFGGNLSLTTPQQFAYAYSEEYEKDTLDLLAKTKAFITKQNYYDSKLKAEVYKQRTASDILLEEGASNALSHMNGMFW